MAMKKALRCILVACCGALLAFALTACMPSANNASNESQAANREYMSEVNQIMTNVNERLVPFLEAVDRGDVVSMRTHADRALQELDALAELEVPEALADIHPDIVAGCEKLRAALNDYINLYVEIDEAGGDIDSDSYAKRLSDIQAQYDEGIALLEKADKAAAEK